MDINVVSEIKCLLGEGPYWDDLTNRIFWVDILQKRFHTYDLKKGNLQSFDIGHMVGCIVPGNDPDTVFAALDIGFASFSMINGELKLISDPEADLTGNRFNDGKCDVMGRFWAGTMEMSGQPGRGALYAMDVDFLVKTKIDRVSISNGLVWPLDNKTMYYIDTLTFQIMAYEFEPETGGINNPEVAVEIPRDEGFPDGMTIDNEGNLWVAHWEGSQVCCWDPQSGQKITSIDLPVSKPTSCTFGGENLDRLFITTARVELDDDQLIKEPLAGSIFVLDALGVKGSKEKPPH